MLSTAKLLGVRTGVNRVIEAPGKQDFSDESLMTALGGGEMWALGQLYVRYARLVAGAVIATAPSLPRSEVDDLCQDVFLEVGRSAGRYKERGKLRSWLYSVAVRTARKQMRRQRVRQRLLDTMTGQPLAIGEQSPISGASAMAKMDVERALFSLSDIQRRLLLLFEYHGMSGEEIADLLDMNLNTVWSHLRRARAAVLAFAGGPVARNEDG